MGILSGVPPAELRPSRRAFTARTAPRTALALAAAVTVVGATLSGVAAAVVRDREHRADEAFARAGEAGAAAVNAEIGRYADVVRNVANAAGSHETLTLQEFRHAIAGLSGMDLAGATSISLVVPAWRASDR